MGSMSFTFWQLLGFLNTKNALEVLMQAGTGNASTGVYGFLAFVSLVGPFIHFLWKDKRAVLGGVLPLLFMLIVGLVAHRSFNSAMGMGGAADPNDPMVQAIQQQVSQAISIGFGVYLSVLASLYFAGMSVKKFSGELETERCPHGITERHRRLRESDPCSALPMRVYRCAGVHASQR